MKLFKYITSTKKSFLYWYYWRALQPYMLPAIKIRITPENLTVWDPAKSNGQNHRRLTAGLM